MATTPSGGCACSVAAPYPWGFAMPEMSLAVAVIAVSAVVSLALCLLFLLVVYLKGGKDDLEAGAKALHKIRNVGVGPSIRRVIEAWKSKGDGS